MSEAFSEPGERQDGADDQVEDHDVGDQVDAEEEGRQADDEEGDEKPRRVADDWEKKAHNQAGRAARERSRRVAAERKNADLEARLEKVERGSTTGPDRDELLELIAGLPDTEDDPVGDIAAVKRALKLFRQRQVAEGEESVQQRAMERQIEGLRNAMLDSEADFSADHPDYNEAATFYRRQRVEELTDAGYTGRNLERKLADDLFGVVRMSLEGGLDPAERVYALAKRRGFKANGKAVDQKLETLRRGTETGIRPQGRPQAGVLSWGDVAKLDGAARDKAWEKLRQREKARK